MCLMGTIGFLGLLTVIHGVPWPVALILGMIIAAFAAVIMDSLSFVKPKKDPEEKENL